MLKYFRPIFFFFFSCGIGSCHEGNGNHFAVLDINEDGKIEKAASYIQFNPNKRIIEKEVEKGKWVPVGSKEAEKMIVVKSTVKHSKNFDISKKISYFIRVPNSLFALNSKCLVEYVGTIPEGEYISPNKYFFSQL